MRAHIGVEYIEDPKGVIIVDAPPHTMIASVKPISPLSVAGMSRIKIYSPIRFIEYLQ